MKIDFQAIREGAEAADKRKTEAIRENFSRMDRQRQKQSDSMRETMSLLSQRLDQDKEADMMREVDKARTEAEQSVRVRFHDKEGTTTWNRTETDEAMLNTIRGLK